MILACAIDRNYAELAGVMLYSIRVNGDIGDIDLYVLGDGLRPVDKERLQASAGRPVTFIDLTDAMLAEFSGFKTNSNWSRAIYARMILPKLLDASVTRLVYLDADTIVNRSIRPLFEMDLQGNIAAAFGRVNERMSLPIGRPADAFYFNSGVILLDLEKWNAEGLTDKALDLIRKKDLPFPDQDALNIVIDSRVLPLSQQWNMQVFEGAEDAAIVHFIHAKPNSTECRHPEQARFLEYRSHTPWAKARLKTKLDKRLRRLRHSFTRRFQALTGR
jgi:lipopolysaccharide biosynthesis glycosyltransferase